MMLHDTAFDGKLLEVDHLLCTVLPRQHVVQDWSVQHAVWASQCRVDGPTRLATERGATLRQKEDLSTRRSWSTCHRNACMTIPLHGIQ